MGGIMKKLLIVFMLSLLVVGMAWGQTPFTATYTFGSDGNVASFVYNGTSYAGITMGNLEKVGITSTSSSNNFRGSGWSLTDIDTEKYIGFTISAVTGYKFTVNSISFGIGRSGTGTRDSQWRGSHDSYATAIDNYTSLHSSLTNTGGVINNPDASSGWTGNVLDLGTTYQDITDSSGFRLYMYNAEATGGTAGLQGTITITGTYHLIGADPTVQTPTFDPPSGSYLEAQNVIITSATEDAVVYYSLASNAGPWTEYSTPLNVTESTTIWAYAVKDGMTDSPVTSAVYVFPTNVANIAALRASATGASLYRLTGEAILTYQNSNRNTKYIQDDTAAIVIDDPSGNITSSYDLYDGITGIIGTLGVYRSLLQFTPVTDPGAATSTDNVVIPEVRTLASLTSDDQGKLIKVNGTTITYGVEFVFPATAQNLTAEDATASRTLRTFVNADYAGLDIPNEPVNMICLVGQYDASMQVSPRFYTDFETIYDLPEGEQVTVDGVTLTLTGGSANSVVGNLASFPPFSNGSFTPVQSIFLTITGGGPWHFDVVTDAPWGAYCYVGVWYAVENTGGHIIFTIDPGKALVIPIVLGDEDPTLPVELSTFTVSLNAFNNAVLNWITQTETGVSGFYVYRNNSENLASAILVSHLIPATNSSEEHSYSFIDNELFSHGTYYYWLQVADIDGSESYHGPATLVYTGNDEPALPSIPTVTELRSVFPNPFNPNTNLSYSLAEEAEVSVKIYNARGQLVRTLNEGRKAVGHHSAAWDGKDDRGQNQSTGVYFFRMQAGKKVFNSKAVLMK